MRLEKIEEGLAMSGVALEAKSFLTLLRRRSKAHEGNMKISNYMISETVHKTLLIAHLLKQSCNQLKATPPQFQLQGTLQLSKTWLFAK